MEGETICKFTSLLKFSCTVLLKQFFRISFGNLQTSQNIINWPSTKNPGTLRITNVIPMIKTNFDRYSLTDTNLAVIVMPSTKELLC